MRSYKVKPKTPQLPPPIRKYNTLDDLEAVVKTKKKIRRARHKQEWVRKTFVFLKKATGGIEI